MPWAARQVRRVMQRSGLLHGPTAVGVVTGGGAPVYVCAGDATTEHTPMYVGSVTKQLVAALAAMEVIAGRLDPEAGVRATLPELPPWAEHIRVRHLVHHLSGLPPTSDVVAAAGVAGEEQLDNARVLAGLARLPAARRRPGVAFEYSNVGYVCLAEVVSRTAGEPLPRLARHRVFDPLGMPDSRLGGPAAAVRPGLPPPPATVGDGGWWTTAADLVRWQQALNAHVLGEDVARLLRTAGRLDDGSPLGYAWGVTVGAPGGVPTLTHGGNWPGWSAKTARQPDRGAAVALLSGSDDVDRVSRTALDVLAAVHPER